jgi:hypothetical protein
MATRFNYRHALRAKGIRPIPPHSKLRTVKIADGTHVELTSTGKVVYGKVDEAA